MSTRSDNRYVSHREHNQAVTQVGVGGFIAGFIVGAILTLMTVGLVMVT
jgi:hypothetical protein